MACSESCDSTCVICKSSVLKFIRVSPRISLFKNYSKAIFVFCGKLIFPKPHSRRYFLKVFKKRTYPFGRILALRHFVGYELDNLNTNKAWSSYISDPFWSQTLPAFATSCCLIDVRLVL
ncbi:unnamed protein product [Moneuplotes crassus]|uniref:Uncharacterized protein n=1 Tax=Euplotes crassus TaxID=5936 RepID=A0AAD1XMR5_EUPCR|nr:unnamed protein product [Moneuplotes crassus]